MIEPPASPSFALDRRARKSRLGPRLLAACLGAAALPGALVLLDMNGIGTERGYWMATGISLVLLCAWPFSARPPRASLGQSGVLALAILTALLLGFLIGSVIATVGVSIWKPEVHVDLPGAGA